MYRCAAPNQSTSRREGRLRATQQICKNKCANDMGQYTVMCMCECAASDQADYTAEKTKWAIDFTTSAAKLRSYSHLPD